MDREKLKAFGILVFTFFLWGSVYVVGKLVSNDMPAQMVAGLRCTTAMAPLLLMARPHLGTKIQREDRKWFFVVGFFGYFGTISLIQLSISLTGASMASLINSMSPVAVTVLAAFVLKEKITPIKCVCLVLSISGAVVVASGAGSRGEMAGILAACASVISWGFASVYMRRLTVVYPAILVTTYSMAVSLIFHIPAAVYVGVTTPFSVTASGVAAILYLGFIGSGLAQYTWTKSLSMLPASICSLFYPLQPVFSAIQGALILGEVLHGTFYIGLGLILLNVILSGWETLRQK